MEHTQWLRQGQKRKRASLATRRRTITAMLFLAPTLFGFFFLVLYPVIASFALSFTEWNGITPIRFTGLSNYAALLKDTTFRISLRNNLVYTGGTVPITIFLATLLALAMNTKVRGIGVYRVIFYLPNITASVAIGIVWVTIFAKYGPLNRMLMALGVKEPVRWLTSSKWALSSVMTVTIWRSIGYYAIILLAGLQAVPAQLYEAANIDGAGPFTKFRKITLPTLSPTIFFCVIMNVINSFQVFDTVMTMTGGGPGRATNVLVYHIYNTAFDDMKYGYASSMAYVLFLVVLVFTLLQFVGQKKWVNY